MSTDLLDEVASVAAQKKAMQEGGCKFLPHGCRLFSIPQGWESNMIRRDKGVSTCETMLELEAAVQDAGVKVLFIPVDALMTDEDIEKICQRNGVTKTLFKEVNEA
ncbi:MAG: hypothetical protein GC185_05825 [Alphaproteobacteria bacterium]|nr:hypothetical protein [Alphaproteobacteria bacterium]